MANVSTLSLMQARVQADKVFSVLFAGLTPLIGFAAGFCATSGTCSSAPAAGRDAAVLLAGAVAFGSVVIRHCFPGEVIGRIYNAIAGAWFSILSIYFSGGNDLAYLTVFLILSLLLLYRAVWPIVFTCSLTIVFYLGGFGLHGMGFLASAFPFLDANSLSIHVLAVLGYSTVIGYLVVKMAHVEHEMEMLEEKW